MKVSVAMITYNQEQYIAQAIEGVLMQDTNFKYEVIIGEDCSTDQTRKIVLDFQRRYPDKVKPLLHTTNQGAGYNFLATLNHGDGKYVAFLDGDDYWTSPHKLQRQVDYLDSHPESSMCFHSVKKFYENGSYRFLSPSEKKEQYAIEELLVAINVHPGSPMYRREILCKFRWPSGVTTYMSGDRIFNTWNAQFGNVGYIDKVMGIYRQSL